MRVMTQRASVEFNGVELVLGILLRYASTFSFEDVCKKIKWMKKNIVVKSVKKSCCDSILLNESNDLKEYEADVLKKDQKIEKIVKKFRCLGLPEECQSQNIKKVYISGKKNKHACIEKLNESYSKIETKSDVYLSLKDGRMVGISVKQSPEATKSNYSVHTLLSYILGKDSIRKELQSIKLGYLHSHGIFENDKSKRDQINKLFYPKITDNPYWNKIREYLLMYNSEIKKRLVELLYCSTIEYPVYEFDGETFQKLNKKFDESEIVLEEHLPYYVNKNGSQKTAAKLFYQLKVKDTVYRIEIRWKGDVYGPSPQFLIHSV